MAAQNEWRNGRIINPLFDGLTYNTSGHFVHCSEILLGHFARTFCSFCSLLVFFLAPKGLGKILRNSQNIRAYYMLNHRIRCMYKPVNVFLERNPSSPCGFPQSEILWCNILAM